MNYFYFIYTHTLSTYTLTHTTISTLVILSSSLYPAILATRHSRSYLSVEFPFAGHGQEESRVHAAYLHLPLADGPDLHDS